MGEHVLMVYILYMYLLYCHKNLTSLLVQPARTHPLGKPSPSGPTSSPACPCAPNVSRFGFAYSASDCQLHDGEDYSYLTHAKHMPGPQLKNTPQVTHLSIPVAHPQPRVCPPPQLSSTQMLISLTQCKSRVPHKLAQHGPQPHRAHIPLILAAVVVAASPGEFTHTSGTD